MFIIEQMECRMSPLIRSMGAGLNMIGLMSPRAAGSLAFWLFCRTGSRKPNSAKEAALFAAAQPRMREATIEQIAVTDGSVAAHIFSPLGPENSRTCLVLHGWGSRIDYIQALVTGLREAGFRVVALDMPGHGLSSGRKLTVPLTLEAIDRAWQRLGPFYAMIGHSFGGYNVIMAAHGAMDTIPAHPASRLVAVASPSDAIGVFSRYGRMLGLSSTVQAALHARILQISGRPVEHFSAARMLGDITTPTLIMHASDDKEVPVQCGLDYAAAGPHVNFVRADGLGHRRIISSPEVMERINSFLLSGHEA
jgi:pimeloyl-ACP methyl ester carboxylesterase